MAYSGEGNLIEAVVFNDPKKTVVPVVCDSDGKLLIDLNGTTITIGAVTVSNFPAIQQVSGTLTVNAGTGFGPGVFPIVTTRNPVLPIGTIVYFQDGLFGVAKGLLLSLTNTPHFIKMIVTSQGLQPIN